MALAQPLKSLFNQQAGQNAQPTALKTPFLESSLFKHGTVIALSFPLTKSYTRVYIANCFFLVDK